MIAVVPKGGSSMPWLVAVKNDSVMGGTQIAIHTG